MLWSFYSFLCMQMFPIAVTCGNTFILKPSEKVPGNFNGFLPSFMKLQKFFCFVLLWNPFWLT